MVDMTDAFLALAVVAACATGETTIVGIANQRVKECNRIAAVCAELRRVGIQAEERPDGLWIRGIGGRFSTLRSASIKCYNDHRVAMAFGVLATVVPGGLTIEDSACVDKTYPTFWDHLTLLTSATCSAPNSNFSAGLTPTSPQDGPITTIAPDTSVLVLGMRGAGKSFLARAAASYLDWEIIDLDEVLEASEGGRCEAVATH